MSSRLLQPPRTLDPAYRSAENTADLAQRVSVLERGPIVAAHVVGATDEPAFQNSFANYHSTWASCRFFKINGRVYIEGTVFSTLATANGATGIIFVLPVGYRPPGTGQHMFSMQGQAGVSRIDVAPNGAVTNQSNSGYNTAATAGGSYFLSLAGINFGLA